MAAHLFGPHLRAVASAAPLIPFRAAAGGMPIVLGLFSRASLGTARALTTIAVFVIGLTCRNRDGR